MDRSPMLLLDLSDHAVPPVPPSDGWTEIVVGVLVPLLIAVMRLL
jgi:hypothetical protein